MVRWALAALPLLLVSCGEPVSTYDPKTGHYVDTEQYRRDQINREIDRRELEKEKL
jgi:hypothetical protein